MACVTVAPAAVLARTTPRRSRPHGKSPYARPVSNSSSSSSQLPSPSSAFLSLSPSNSPSPSPSNSRSHSRANSRAVSRCQSPLCSAPPSAYSSPLLSATSSPLPSASPSPLSSPSRYAAHVALPAALAPAYPLTPLASSLDYASPSPSTSHASVSPPPHSAPSTASSSGPTSTPTSRRAASLPLPSLQTHVHRAHPYVRPPQKRRSQPLSLSLSALNVPAPPRHQEPDADASKPRNASNLSSSFPPPSITSPAPPNSGATPAPPLARVPALQPHPSGSTPGPSSAPPVSSSIPPPTTYSHPASAAPPSPSSNATAACSYTQITPHLSIADLAFAEDAALLRKEGVTHVVSVLGERVHIPPCIPPAHHLHVRLDDAPFAELVGALGPVAKWVGQVLRGGGVITAPDGTRAVDEDANELVGTPDESTETKQQHIRILIHCAQGISRSPAVGAALLVALPLVESDYSDYSDSALNPPVDRDAPIFTQPFDTSAAAIGPESDSETAEEAEPTSQPTPSATKLDWTMNDVDSDPTTPKPMRTSHAPWTSDAYVCDSPAAGIRRAWGEPAAPLIPFRASPSKLGMRTPRVFSASSSSSLPVCPSPHSASALASLPSMGTTTSAAAPVRRKLSAPAALAYVAARRPSADVNWGFRAQLAEWEAVCRDGEVL